MALDADQVRVGVTGHLFTAPVGTAPPDDVTAAWAAAWRDLGYLSDDGPALTPSTDKTDIMVWQSLAAVRTIMTARSYELKYTLMQSNIDTFVLAMGGGEVTAEGVAPNEVFHYTAPLASDVDERAFGLEVIDGDLVYRFVFPRGLVTDVGDIAFTRSDAIKYELTTTVMAVDDVTPLFDFLTNDPAFEPVGA